MLTPDALLQGRYRIVRRIGGGGMGVVYLAEDTRLPGRRCAAKEMSPDQLASQDRAWAMEAFRQEAQMLGTLSHPGLTPVTDFFFEEGNWYLVMDFVEGETLKEHLGRAPGGRLGLEEALDITRQVCDVLEYLHGHRPPVVFRDLKPGNVMITPGGEVKLIDFGIARFFKPGRAQDTVNLGTPGYAAPEQYGGRGQSDARSDVYSLGVLLHQMTTGYDPAAAVTPFPLPPPGSLMRGLPVHVERVISRATQLQPDDRYQSVGELRQALFLPTRVMPPAPVAAATRGVAESAVPYAAPPAAVSARPSRGILRGAGLAMLIAVSCAVVGLGIYGVWALTRGEQGASGLPLPTVTPLPVLSPRPSPFPTATSAPAATSTSVPAATPTAEPTLFTPFDQVLVPGGTFIRGSTPADIQAAADRLCADYADRWCQVESFEDELMISDVPAPRSDVFYLDSLEAYAGDFYIDRYEVTNAQYAACVRAGVCTPPERAGTNPRRAYFSDPQRGDFPVVYVTWHDARAYCAWAGGRLPTADEWEKAARGTDGRWWPWGNVKPTTEANFRQPGEEAATEDDTALVGGDLAPVGFYPGDSSPYGVMDMGGNVMEWVDAQYGPGKREIRGGSWNTGSFSLRAAGRVGADPANAYFDVGFRCARDVGS